MSQPSKRQLICLGIDPTKVDLQQHIELLPSAELSHLKCDRKMPRVPDRSHKAASPIEL